MCDPQTGAELVCFSGIFISLLSANRKINETADQREFLVSGVDVKNVL